MKCISVTQAQGSLQLRKLDNRTECHYRRRRTCERRMEYACHSGPRALNCSRLQRCRAAMYQDAVLLSKDISLYQSELYAYQNLR